MLYTLNIYNIIFQLYLNETGKIKKQNPHSRKAFCEFQKAFLVAYKQPISPGVTGGRVGSAILDKEVRKSSRRR